SLSLVLLTPRPPSSTLFPYTTLFRSAIRADERRPAVVHPCPRRAGPPRRGLHLRPQRRDDEPAPHWPQCTGANAARQLPHTFDRSEEHTSELQSREKLVCRLLLEKKK